MIAGTQQRLETSRVAPRLESPRACPPTLRRHTGVFARWLAVAALSSPGSALHAVQCPAPENLGPSPETLLVVVPGTGQRAEQWESFLAALRKEPAAKSRAWLFFDHGVSVLSVGRATQVATRLSSCVNENLKARASARVVLIGHSIGGMLVRRAYLEAAGALPGRPAPPDSWSSKVDRILLFASVNKGVRPGLTWWSALAAWALRAVPHPHLVLEDLLLGSNFIADVRVAWIRHFGSFYGDGANAPIGKPPMVVQFWGTEDSIVTRGDNAEIEAFSGRVLEEVAGATHGNLNRLEPSYADDPAARWALYRRYLLETPKPLDREPEYERRRVLFIARGIRDSTNSEWVAQLRRKAEPIYGADNIEEIEYGYFSAAHFAVRPIRAKNIPLFRDRYAERLAENPLTAFDFIGHSNGTYILGHSLLSTPSMKFRHVVLVAPVLAPDFNWVEVSGRGQIEAVRYDTALWDWPVGVLCQALRAIGFDDVGPSGVALFGEGTMLGSRITPVGWHRGGHGEALRTKNLDHLIWFADTGKINENDPSLADSLTGMRHISRATPYVIWTLAAILTLQAVRLLRRRGRISVRAVYILIATVAGAYAFLDVI